MFDLLISSGTSHGIFLDNKSRTCLRILDWFGPRLKKDCAYPPPICTVLVIQPLTAVAILVTAPRLRRCLRWIRVAGSE